MFHKWASLRRREAINSAGLIVGTYEDLALAVRSFVKDGRTCSDVIFPAATITQAMGTNDGGLIVGSYFECAFIEQSPAPSSTL